MRFGSYYLPYTTYFLVSARAETPRRKRPQRHRTPTSEARAAAAAGIELIFSGEGGGGDRTGRGRRAPRACAVPARWTRVGDTCGLTARGAETRKPSPGTARPGSRGPEADWPEGEATTDGGRNARGVDLTHACFSDSSSRRHVPAHPMTSRHRLSRSTPVGPRHGLRIFDFLSPMTRRTRRATQRAHAAARRRCVGTYPGRLECPCHIEPQH